MAGSSAGTTADAETSSVESEPDSEVLPNSRLDVQPDTEPELQGAPVENVRVFDFHCYNITNNHHAERRLGKPPGQRIFPLLSGHA
jgi:hypothetical protein